MQELLSTVKGRFPKATITLLDDSMVQVDFPKAKESVIIQQEEGKSRFTVSYPEQLRDSRRNILKDQITTLSNILPEGLLWILKKVDKYGFVPPPF